MELSVYYVDIAGTLCRDFIDYEHPDPYPIEVIGAQAFKTHSIPIGFKMYM